MGTPHDPLHDRSIRSARKAGERRRYLVGFAISLLAHAAVVVLYPFFGGVPEGGPSFVPLTPAQQRFQGTRIVRIEELPAGTPEAEPDTPVEVRVERPDPGSVTTEAPTDAELDTSLPAPLRSVAERLRAQAAEGDPRIWAEVERALGELTPEQRARLQFLTRLEELNDSAAAAAEAAAALTDWTYTDEEGRRWGISPGRLHLGNLTLPLPFGFSAPPDPTGANTRRAWMWDDIENQAGSAAAQESWKERAEAMRRRREALRADTSGVPR